MLAIYLFLCLVFVLIGRNYYRNYINPITIYSVVWFMAFFAHESSYVAFDYISWGTFWIIVLAHVAFFFGSIAGTKYVRHTKRIVLFREKREEDRKKSIIRWIVVLSVVALIGIAPSFIYNLSHYGLNVFRNFAALYKMQLTSEFESGFDLSSILFVVSPLICIYILTYGWSNWLIIPIIDILLFGLNNGSRGSLIIIFTMLISNLTIRKKESKKIEGKQRRILYVIGAIMIAIVVACTRSRSLSTGKTDSTNSVLTFVVTYLGGGIGCLDKYLKNPIIVNYPQYFFRVPYLILNRLGFTHVDTTYRIPTYFIPFSSNVITYIGELYHDFQMGFFIIIFLLAFVMSSVYSKAVEYNSTTNKMFYASFFTIVVLSFFANFGHTASVWYVLMIGGFIGCEVDYHLVKKSIR